jgi:hypothetical protein
MCNVSKTGGLERLIDWLAFNALQLRIALSCPKIFGLGSYYSIDKNTLARIRFEARPGHHILVSFLPSIPEAETGVENVLG